MKKTLTLLCLALGSFGAAHATNYYVSSGLNAVVAGQDATTPVGRGLSPALPFASIQYASDRTNPGDTVFVRQGTYTPPFNFGTSYVLAPSHSGAPGRYIVYRNYPADAQRPLLVSDRWDIIKLFGDISYIEINGLRIQGNNANVLLADALNQGGSCATNGSGSPENVYNTNGISTGGTRTPGARNPHHLRFINNEVFDCGGAGIGTGNTDYVTIENNLVYNCSWYTKYATSGIAINDPYNSDVLPGYHIIIRNNRCFGNKNLVPWWRGGTIGCAGITDGNGIILDTYRGSRSNNNPPNITFIGRTLVANNLVVNNGGSGIHALKADNIDFINNTAYHNSQSSSIDNGQIYANDADNVVFQNNILNAGPGKRVNSNTRSTNTIWRNNLFFGGTSTAITGTAAVRSDALFVNPTTDWTTADFRLRTGSPALGTGLNNALTPATDLTGRVRPAGTTTDLGAYSGFVLASKGATANSAGFQLFPNPATGTVELAMPLLNLTGTAELFDKLGRLQSRQPVRGDRATLSLAGLRPGLYLVRVQTREGLFTQRLVVE